MTESETNPPQGEQAQLERQLHLGTYGVGTVVSGQTDTGQWLRPPLPKAARPVITIDRDQIIHRNGKDFVLYAGLLHAATMAGLYETQTALVQAPGPGNNNTAICHARMVFPWGSFEGLGDANATNTNRQIAVHLIRMAETRAKARALRDALDVGMAAVEELGPGGRNDDEEEDDHGVEDDEPAPARASRPSPPDRSQRAAPPVRAAASGPASREAEVEKYQRIMVTARRLKDSGDLKVGKKDWDELSAPFTADADAAYIAGQYQKVLALVNQAVKRPTQ